MSVPTQIENYLESLPEPKRSEMKSLHERILNLLPGTRLWFHDGTDDTGKVVSNPNIGYGFYTIRYANKKTLDWFRASISANTVGISVYLLGIKDKNFLKESYGSRLGKASISGYCIKFKKLGDIHLEVLDESIRKHVQDAGH